MKKADDLVAACAAVIDSAAAGQLTLQEAREFMELLDAQRKAIETQDLVVRTSTVLFALTGFAFLVFPRRRPWPRLLESDPSEPLAPDHAP